MFKIAKDSKSQLSALETLCSRYSTNPFSSLDYDLVDLLIERGKADLSKVREEIVRKVARVLQPPSNEVTRRFAVKVLQALGTITIVKFKERQKRETKG